MAEIVSTEFETETIDQLSDQFASSTIGVHTDDGHEHRVIFNLDHDRYDPQDGHTPVFLGDHITDYNAFTPEAAVACAEAYELAVSELDSLFDTADTHFDYTLDTDPYVLHVATYAAIQTDTADMPRPNTPDGYTIKNETVENNRITVQVVDDDGTDYSVQIRDGAICDVFGENSDPNPFTLAGLFAAARTVQAEWINRGRRLDPTMQIELYHADG